MNLVDDTGSLVVEPDWTSLFNDELEIAAAHEHWRVISTELRERQILSPANAHALLRLIVAYVSFDRASREVAENGAVMKPRRNNAKSIARVSPWFVVMREASADATGLESKLGLTPRDRNAAGKVEPKKSKARARDAYFRPVA
ncbi:P27 family phage terminase small subunit [Mesorhizobium sp. BE184]|uniref:P27 family phage terminase small subunit n=1 Tax=Mesorhizobium sp. BE184 TaxID=2817714 RepID=UPI00286053D9|nr:P27 family phage terminase small subunit [Mesorhizobium sp. BE184]MDR7034505.1 P27 family predicted phage terminase small subunit [Mesorhizobium sp. BE184]